MVMEVLPGNGLQSTLNGAITAAATSLTIQTGDAGSWPSSGQYRAVLCQDPVNGPFELVRITGGQGTATLTVVRGAESYNGSTTAYAWPSGSTISAVITNGGLAAYLGAGNFLPLTGGTLTGNLTVQGQLGVGAPVLSNTGMVVLTPSTQLAGATQYGALFAAITSSVATVMGAAVAAQSATQPASFTQAESTDFLALGPSWGSGSSITNAIGVHVNNQGGGQATNAYGVYIDAQSGSSQNVGLYNAGTTQLNSFLGIGIGPSSTTMVWLQGGSTLTGTQQSGLAVTTNFNSSATVSGASISVGFQTAAQVFTMTSGYGLQIQAALVQSGATVTTMYGIYVNNQTVSGVGTSYGVYIADQTGSTNNVGLWCLGQARFDRGIGMGTVPNPSVGFRMSSTLLISTSPNGYGFWVNPTFNSQTTATAAAIACSVITQAAGFTVTSGYALWVQTPVLGSGSAITTQYGVYVRNQGVSGIANAYGLYLENTSGASSTNISLYNAGSTQLSTAVGMGTAPISNQLVMASGMSIVQGTTGAANNSLDRTGIMGGTDPAYALRVNGAAWYAGNVSAGGFSTNGNFQTGGWMQGQYFVTDGDYRGGSVNVDRNGLGDGTVNQPWLHFAGGGEGLGSKRTSGGNQNGLDFYQGNTVRMQVNNQGNISIGAANPSPNQSSLYVNPTALGGLNQFGVQVVVNGTSAGTSGIIGVSAVMTTAAASYTVGTGYTFLAYGPSLGAGSSLTTQYGLYVANQGAAGITSAFGIYIAAQSGASSSNYGIYCVADVLIAAQSSGSHLNVLVRTAATRRVTWAVTSSRPTTAHPSSRCGRIRRRAHSASSRRA